MPQAHFMIVTQILSRSSRVFRSASFRRWALALILPFGGAVTAFGIAPETITESVEQRRVVETITLSPATATSETVQTFWREERIQRGETQASLLARLGVEDEAAVNYLRTTRDARSLFQLVPGRAVSAETTVEGQLVTLRYLNGATLLTVTREGDTFSATE